MNKSWNDEPNKPEHIRVYIENFGRIPDNYHVHHIDNNHDNNDPNNLVAIPKSYHKSLHSNYGFYLSIARANLITKELLLELLQYYRDKGYSTQKSFMVVLVEFLLSKRSLK